MKILFLHPYNVLGDWNHRLKRQIELIEKHFEVKVWSTRIEMISGVTNEMKADINKLIKEFQPDIVYICGYALGSAIDFKNIIYDMGSFITRNILLKEEGLLLPEMLKMAERELMGKIGYSNKVDFHLKEKQAIEKAKAVICWEGDEHELAEKIFKCGKKLIPVSFIFSEIPEPIPFKDKIVRTMAIAPKWGDKETNLSLLRKVEGEINIMSVGHDGNWKRFLPHNRLMDELNKSRVLFVPHLAGGFGTIMDGLRLGCNVVTYDWNAFNYYVNDELISTRRGAYSKIQKALENYYPPKRDIPTEKEQLNKIIKICERITKS